MTRSRWEVVPAGRFLGWRVTYNGNENRRFFLKQYAIDWAVAFCWHYWETQAEQSELIIKRRDGQIMDTRTYGNDPEGVKG